jgi:hypothetical protein
MYISPVQYAMKTCQQYSLSADECRAFKKAIYKEGKEYTSAILNGKKDRATTSYIENLTTAISKLPKANNLTVYRNDDFSPNQLKDASNFFRAHIGETFAFQIFLSTTKRPVFTGNKGDYTSTIAIKTMAESCAADIHFAIESNGGRNPEEEVLFTIESVFHITKDVKGELLLVESEDKTSPLIFPRLPF